MCIAEADLRLVSSHSFLTGKFFFTVEQFRIRKNFEIYFGKIINQILLFEVNGIKILDLPV
jgi:hypothetical protein